MEPYDSRDSTLAHIGRVAWHLGHVSFKLERRAVQHDASKLGPEEKAAFDRGTPGLKHYTYGTPEYKAAFATFGMQDAIAHHYAVNSHHPEHYPNGIDGMSLLDLIEMVCDWKAACERHDDGDFHKSLLINRKRFAIGEQLFAILVATAKELGYIERDWTYLPVGSYPKLDC